MSVIVPTVVQFVFARSSGTATSVTTGAITVTAGNLLLAIVNGFVGSKIGSAPVSDSRSQTWQTGLATSATTGIGVQAMYVPNGAGGSTTFTFTPTSTDFIDICVLEIANAPISSPINGTSKATSTGTSHNSGTITSTNLELFVGFTGGGTSAGNLPVLTQGGVWSQVVGIPSSATQEGLLVATRFAAAGVTDQIAFTSAISETSEGMVLGIKSVGGGANRAALPAGVSGLG